MPIVLNGDGPVTGLTSLNTTVSDTELGYLDGVTSAIQTQINGAGGLVKITDQSFSAVSAVNVNNCFTSTYVNYLVIIRNTQSNSVAANFRLRVGGSDATGSVYDYAQIGRSSDGVTQTNQGTNASAADLYGASPGPNMYVLSVSSPNLAEITTVSMQSTLFTTISYSFVGGIVHEATTAYDGFSFYPASGTVTGNLRVYGFRN